VSKPPHFQMPHLLFRSRTTCTASRHKLWNQPRGHSKNIHGKKTTIALSCGSPILATRLTLTCQEILRSVRLVQTEHPARLGALPSCSNHRTSARPKTLLHEAASRSASVAINPRKASSRSRKKRHCLVLTRRSSCSKFSRWSRLTRCKGLRRQVRRRQTSCETTASRRYWRRRMTRQRSARKACKEKRRLAALNARRPCRWSAGGSKSSSSSSKVD